MSRSKIDFPLINFADSDGDGEVSFVEINASWTQTVAPNCTTTINPVNASKQTEREAFVAHARELLEDADKILQEPDISHWFFGHVSDVADELSNFINLVTIEGLP